MNKLSIKSRFIGIFSLLVMCTIFIGGFAVSRIDVINSGAIVISSNVDGLEQLYNFQTNAQESVVALEKAFDTPPGASRDALLATAATKRDSSTAEWKMYDKTCDPGEERADADRVNAVLETYLKAVKSLQDNGASQVDPAQVKTAVALGYSAIEAAKSNIAYQTAQAHASMADASAAASFSSAIIEVALAVIVAISLALITALLKSVIGPMKKLTGIMSQLAQGDREVVVPGVGRKDELGAMARAVLVFKDSAIQNARLGVESAAHASKAEAERSHSELAQREAIVQERAIVANSIGAGLIKLAAKDLTFRMSSEIPDAYRKLQTDFNAAIEQLEGAMQGVSGSADAIQAGTQEISTASDDLSHRTEQQAASLKETAAALDEITATVRKSAEGAKHAREVVASADHDAKNSAVVVRQAVEAMDGIAKSSMQITQIIGVIDEIAFQTNLLALNAGVEAARAGEAGRGFAVVASEVRALAQRSADAAKQIKGLISTSTTQVDLGVKLVAETGKSLERIVAQVIEINGVVAAIAAGALEQATGLQQVNTAIKQMDQTTQQNAMMVEESSAASHSLSQETTQLSNLIGKFLVGRTTDNSLRRQPQKAAPQAFRASIKTPVAIGSRAKTHAVASHARPERRPEAAMSARAPSKATANGADGVSWDEF